MVKNRRLENKTLPTPGRRCAVISIISVLVTILVMELYIIHYKRGTLESAIKSTQLTQPTQPTQPTPLPPLNRLLGDNHLYLDYPSTEREDSNKSEIVNVAFVCVGEKSLNLIEREMKTMLYHRSVPVHVYIIGDEPCFQVVSTALKHWKAYGCNATLYRWERYKEEVEWIPNTHYSGIYGSLKMIMANILPTNVKQLILLDTDLIFNACISQLWQHFSNFTQDQLFAVSKEMSPWYSVSDNWPAKNRRGFNTGVLLLHLERMRERDWDAIWKSEIDRPLQGHPKLVLGDQDIFNVVAKERPKVIYELPCAWNVQWRHDRIHCLEPEISSELKIMHFNEPVKDVPDSMRTKEFVELMNFVDNMNPPK